MGAGFPEDAVDTLDRFGEMSFANDLTKPTWDTLVNVDLGGLALEGAHLWLKTLEIGQTEKYVELVPEPATLGVLVLGAVGVLLRRRRVR